MLLWLPSTDIDGHCHALPTFSQVITYSLTKIFISE